MISLLLSLFRSTKQDSTQHYVVDSQERNFGKTDEIICNNLLGVVTSICKVNSYGVINKGIYFDFNVVLGNEEIKVGDHVCVCASRRNKMCGFVASSVTLCHNDWDRNTKREKTHDDEKDCVPIKDIDPGSVKYVEGRITEIRSLYGILDGKYRFSIMDCEMNFIPVVGDLVIVSIVPWKSEERVISWRPKTVKKIEGTISSRELDWGVINDDTVFFISSCKCNFSLSVSQKVWAHVITSSCSPYFTWRAFSLEPYLTLVESSCKPIREETDELFIIGDLNFYEVYVGEEKDMSFSIKNNGEQPLTIFDIRFQKPGEKCPFIVHGTEKRVILPNSEICFTISCKSSMIGRDQNLLIFEFEDFVLSKEVTVQVIDPAQHVLNPTAPYKYESKNRNVQSNMDSKHVIPGQKVFNPKANFSGYSPQYAVPSRLRSAVEQNAEISEIAPVLFDELTLENYCKKFGCLLHLEEIQAIFDMAEFEMTEVVLQRKGPFLVLEVLGLAEGRPSLIVGDKAMLWPPNDSSNHVYEGYIHEVHQNDVFLKFHQDFQNSYNGETFNVYFVANRSNFKRCHQAIHHMYNSSRFMLNPKSVQLKWPLVELFSDKNRSSGNKHYTKAIKWRNRNLNAQQKLAVERILQAQCRPLPYIVFGPPGTGKTITLVESVLQVFSFFKNARILVCTPSNSAADLFCHRLLESKVIGKSDLVRLNSYQRNIDAIPDFIKPFCQDKDDILNVINFPIIISTCSNASIFYTTNMASNHFTHVFVDEAGQLTEPECMIAVGIISTHYNGSLVMAGDPKQLGAMIRSSVAKSFGLEISYMERIMQLPLYQRDERKFKCFNGYDPKLVTMLTDCYRMHPAILQYPSETFYYSQVKCCVPEERHVLFSNWEVLPKKGFPIIFHGIQGTEEREENSPSWFNSAEIVESSSYLRKLYSKGLNSSDVGIITPYKKQTEKMRLFLSALHLDICKIGSVEEFQGQERRAIIISTVRSNENHIENDIIHNLGFLSNPKRFNVAVTRAQELLIVVGNPSLLSVDDCWKTFIRYCIINGGYTGWTPSSFDD